MSELSPTREHWRAEIRRRLEPLSLSPIREAEIVEELAQHLDDRYREFRALGHAHEAAADMASREFRDGEAFGRELARVEARAPLDLPPAGAPARGRWVAAFLHDMRQAVHALLKAPGFSLAVVLVLALSIGPVTAIISVGNLLVWRPHPGVTDASRLAEVWVGRWSGEDSLSPSWVTYANLDEISGRATRLLSIAGVQEMPASWAVPGLTPETVRIAHITANFFDVLGVRLRAGRAFLAEEDRGAGVPVAVISEGRARLTFGSVEDAVGKTVLLNSRAFAVVGVVPASFRGMRSTSSIDVWIPGAAYGFLNHFRSLYSPRFYSLVARLAPDSTATEAEHELNAILAGLAGPEPTNELLRASTARVFSGLGAHPLGRTHTRQRIQMLLAIGAVLLVLGCANAANLLVFRASRQRQEIAIRKALGASRARLIQAHVLESCLLATVGAGLGLVLAVLLKQLISRLLLPSTETGPFSVPIDIRVLAATAITALATGLSSAAASAWFATGEGAASIAGTTMRVSARAPRLRGALAALQLALSLTLLVGALLLVTTLRNLRSVDLGYAPGSVTAMSVRLDSHGLQPPQALQYLRDVLAGLEAHGQFESVALAASAVEPGYYQNVTRPDGMPVEVAVNGVGHSYFETMSIPIRGRAFTAEEVFADSGEPPVIVSEMLAMRVFGTGDVIGRALRFEQTPQEPKREFRIVGVAGDIRGSDLAGPPEPILYEPFGRFARSGELMVRSSLSSAEVGAIAKEVAARVNGSIPLSGVRALSEDLDNWLTEQRLFAWMLSVLGALGFVLAALGLYGLVSQAAQERRREFGIRLAVGAQRSAIASLLARYALAVSAGGVIVGIGLSYVGSRVIGRMLYGVSRLEPSVYLAAVATLVLVVAAACVAPVVRALRVQPVEVLRTE